MVSFSPLRTILILAMVASAGLASTNHTISRDVYDDLVYYFKYSSSAYSMICLWPNGHHLVDTFKSILTGTQGFIARDEDRGEIVLSLRGSLSVADIITDSRVNLTPFDSPGVTAPWGTMVHAGFLAGWNSVATTVLATVNSELQKYPGYNLVVTGHSLGGAVASFAALSFRAKFPFTNITLYTYGQPRTGNSIYADWVNSELGANVFRVVHTYDGVPTMIPIDMLPIMDPEPPGINRHYDGYRHYGIEYWQVPDPASENTTRRCAAHGEDPDCSLSIPSSGVNFAHFAYFGIMALTPFCYAQTSRVQYQTVLPMIKLD